MSQTTVPGIKASHAIITSACRANRGDVGALDEALARVRTEALRVIQGWGPEVDARFHLVFTLEKPED